ncbi:group I intron-associated PD-(D/E)XK endonuclease [Geminocystis sp. GBBB08]|uniref:group I intron-associated PD-(D/E)XK endonuclease n=1 Tax=Geminocystis sp. GBBB08 TaxID=2604140 RepID=UPI0027E236C4|nr:group I intron-associated PD-(D/E)XK endonuclease [Geminocystis sp. GBBB08]MBL1210655.1 hypothetical protein [Geminocystis sp. GBBB08]
MNEDDLIKELINKNYVKKGIADIAQKYQIPQSELKKFYTLTFFSEIAEDINLKNLTEINISEIEKMISEDKKQKFKFIKTEFKNILEKCLYIALTNGFKVNINNINSGVMTSNAGDSAEFIFVARAILAGFNCSSVDVRSSRYDAIIDYNDTLLRVQIKGISTGNNISFKDRDKEEQEINYSNKRNRSKRITSQDCDFFVIVDKQVGICYIIPMNWIDRLSDEELTNIKLQDIINYKQNWDIIKNA